MLMLVMSNNFLQLFFGWEAVGLVSYLLIGFWYTRPTAIFANLKAFLVNRVGDFGFLLGIGLVLAYFGTLDYAPVFAQAPRDWRHDDRRSLPGAQWSLMTVICICLFIGAMGKSAQVPLHVWLPDSMEGPTPISALIHAATMVTAGIFMVARMSPLFELSDTALSFVTSSARSPRCSWRFLGIVQNDIKRVVAYSTLSQLGYMTVALGASAYSAAMFHLMTHAFFKALLFLGAGSVIIAHAPRAGHAQHGRPAQVHADHLDHDADRLARAGRHSAVRRLLLEGRDHRGGAPVDDRRARLRLFRRAGRRVRHGVLFVPDVVPGVPRRRALPTTPHAAHAHARATRAHDAPSRPAAEPDAHDATHAARRTNRRGSSRCR